MSDHPLLRDLVTFFVIINPLGTSGIVVVSRLEGLILTAVAVETPISNLKTAFPGL